LAKTWQGIGAKEHFRTFHLADFEGRYPQFASKEWSDEAKRRRMISALLTTIRDHDQLGPPSPNQSTMT
jgi:hypothetical protein